MSWRAELLTLAERFGAAWALARPDVPVRWPNAPGPAVADARFVRFAIVPGTSRAIGTSADGRRLYRHDGLATIDLFAPPGEGLAPLLGLADAAAAILRGWNEDGLRCGAPRLSLRDDEDGWRQAALAIPFQRDTLY
ncbi:MAG: phage tail terminator-like protein [Alphaproteobacteria bacterium]